MAFSIEMVNVSGELGKPVHLQFNIVDDVVRSCKVVWDSALGEDKEDSNDNEEHVDAENDDGNVSEPMIIVSPKDADSVSKVKSYVSMELIQFVHYFPKVEASKKLKQEILELLDQNPRITLERKGIYRTLFANVAKGATISYKRLGEMILPARIPRAVGQDMKTNMYPILIPCHRVLSHDGGEGGYMGAGVGDESAKSKAKLSLKRALLTLEGVVIK